MAKTGLRGAVMSGRVELSLPRFCFVNSLRGVKMNGTVV